MTFRLDPQRDGEFIKELIRTGKLKDEALGYLGSKLKKSPDLSKRAGIAVLPGTQVTQISISIPMPPSVNEMHGKRHDGTIGHTKVWRDYKKTITLACLLHKTGWIQGKIEVTAKFYFTNEQSDLDNRLKALFDSLQGVCYANDKQIRKYTDIEALIDVKNPRVDVVLKEYSQELPK